MKRKAKVSMKFIKDSVSKKISIGAFILKEMQSSAIFPSPPIAYATMQAIQNKLSDAAANALTGLSRYYTVQDQAEKDWDKMMRKQAEYVTEIADGDLEKIAESGFHSTVTETNPWKIPELTLQPQMLYDGDSGFVIKVKKPQYATCFSYILTTEPDRIKYDSDSNRIIVEPGHDTVHHICDTHKKIKVRGLSSGTRYHLFVFPTGPAGTGYHAPVVSLVFP